MPQDTRVVLQMNMRISRNCLSGSPPHLTASVIFRLKAVMFLSLQLFLGSGSLVLKNIFYGLQVAVVVVVKKKQKKSMVAMMSIISQLTNKCSFRYNYRHTLLPTQSHTHIHTSSTFSRVHIFKCNDICNFICNLCSFVCMNYICMWLNVLYMSVLVSFQT